MKIEKYLFNNSIIITDSSNKNRLLELFCDRFITSKIYSYNEIINNIVCVDDNYKLKLISKYNYNFELIDIISSYFPFIKANSENDKIKKIYETKELVKEYFKVNEEFITYLNSKQIIFYNSYEIKRNEELILNKYLELSNTIRINEEIKIKKELIINKFKTSEEEVSYISEQILKLLKNVSPEKILIHISNPKYKNIVKRIFTQFNIPFILKNESNLFSYDMTKYFLELFRKDTEIEEILEIIRQTYNLDSQKNNKVYNSIIDILNKYDVIKNDDFIKFLEYEFNKCIPVFDGINKIKEVSVDKYKPKVDEYLFVLGFNQNYFPALKSSNDYLTEEEKNHLQINTVTEENKNIRKKHFHSLNEIYNLTISFSENINGEELSLTTFIEEFSSTTKVEIEEKKYGYSSFEYNKYLLSKSNFKYKKFSEINDEYVLLYSNYKDNFKTFNNKYSKIDVQSLNNFLDNKLTLSYSSLDNFYKCSFKFYLSNILKIREDKVDTPSIVVGKIVHSILCTLFKCDFMCDVENLIDTEIDNYFKGKINYKQKFYNNKYKKAILELTKILQKQKEQTKFKAKYLEEEFCVKFDKDLNVNLKGYIDKILTFEDKNNTYFIIIDYKTGNIDTNINPIIYGLNSQLLIYYYLLNKNFENSKLMGIYYQNIMKDVLSSEDNKSYNDILSDKYKLSGYTNAETSILNDLDTNLENSYIKGLKMKKDGEFYHYTKILTETNIESLLEIADKNIRKAIDQIMCAEFVINPKKIGNEKEISSCKYCIYSDICFKTDDDIKYLKEYKNLEFLEGDPYE